MLFYLFFLFTIIIDVKSVERERERDEKGGGYVSKYFSIQSLLQLNVFIQESM